MKKAYFQPFWLKSVPRGWGNGYVIIPKGHPLHGLPYNYINVDVHGGLTFGKIVDERIAENLGLSEGDIGSYAVGFDTAHYGDNERNCNKAFVERETENLLQQLLNYKF